MDKPVHFHGKTKEEAIRLISDGFERNGSVASVKIHHLDGTIEEERTYPRSADPRKSPG